MSLLGFALLNESELPWTPLWCRRTSEACWCRPPRRLQLPPVNQVGQAVVQPRKCFPQVSCRTSAGMEDVSEGFPRQGRLETASVSKAGGRQLKASAHFCWRAAKEPGHRTCSKTCELLTSSCLSWSWSWCRGELLTLLKYEAVSKEQTQRVLLR